MVRRIRPLLSIFVAVTSVLALIGIGETGDPVAEAAGLAAGTAGRENDPAVAASPAGDFLVVWERDEALHAQRYTAQGLPTGAELQVAEAPAETPAVTHLAGGGFLVVWTASDLDGARVLARVLDPTGAPAGESFAVAPDAPLDQRGPDVAVNRKGRGLVTWEGGELVSSDIGARLLRVNGRPRGTAFVLNGYTTGAQLSPRVATSRPARFIVVWASDGGRDGDDFAVFGQRIRRTGEKIGTEFQVNAYTTGRQNDPDVTGGRAGSFVVVWGGGATYGTGSQGHYGADSPGIRGQRFTRRATRLGTEFTASAFEYGPHRDAQIDSDDEGRFVVAWTQGQDYYYHYSLGESCGSIDGGASAGFVCEDGSGLGVFRQAFDEHADKVGGEIGSTGFRDQLEPSVAVAPSGRFVVAWTDVGCRTAESYACRYSGEGTGVSAVTEEVAPPSELFTR